MSSPAPRLAFIGVDAAGAEGGPATLLHQGSFELHPGELLWLGLEDPADMPVLADLAEGLEEPDAGTVCFDGRDWTGLPASAALAARGTIGRLHSAAAWLSNLDLDENILLAALHHGRRTAPDLRDEAAAWAAHFGLAQLPHARPAWATARERHLCQWIRALLGPPALLMVEDPGAKIARALSAAEAAAVARLRAGGTAVLWLAPRGLQAPPGLPGARRCEIVDGRLKAMPETDA